MIPETRTRYGRTQAERVQNPLWDEAIRENWTGYQLRTHLGIKLNNEQFRHKFWLSAYQDADPGPFWSWERYGRTSTPLPDGRVIHIAGEHEDAYDSDFCIYNDVVVEYPGGRREIYLYPKGDFPPTDFHTATLAGSDIWLIGSLGYDDLRQPGETQVLKFDTKTLRFQTMKTTGEVPGWISRHTAERLSETSILVVGGKAQSATGYAESRAIFELDLTTLKWRTRRHGDEAIFPVAAADYAAFKNPRDGAANPERSTNPFWLEMARRQWTPNRARLHYGDFAPPEPKMDLSNDGPAPAFDSLEYPQWFEKLRIDLDASKLKRTREDVVWTAMREGSVKLGLPDGRKVQIGGRVEDFGDDYADPWAYNDVIVTRPSSEIEILAYPSDVFPHFGTLAGLLDGDAIYIFGQVDPKFNAGQTRRVVVLRLNLSDFAITTLADGTNKDWIAPYPRGETRDGGRVIFTVTRRTNSDPELGIAFDLKSHAWSDPFPFAHKREE